MKNTNHLTSKCHFCPNKSSAQMLSIKVTYFTIFLLFRPLWTSNSVLQGDVLDQSIVFRYGKIWLFLLTKIEFNSTVVAENMWEEWPISKNFLTDFEGNTKVLSILCIGEFYFITFKVLLIGGEGGERLSFNLLPVKLRNFNFQTSDGYPMEILFRFNLYPKAETILP